MGHWPCRHPHFPGGQGSVCIKWPCRTSLWLTDQRAGRPVGRLTALRCQHFDLDGHTLMCLSAFAPPRHGISKLNISAPPAEHKFQEGLGPRPRWCIVMTTSARDLKAQPTVRSTPFLTFQPQEIMPPLAAATSLGTPTLWVPGTALCVCGSAVEYPWSSPAR